MSIKRGSVLLFSMVIMGVVTIVTQQLIKTVAVGSSFTSIMVAREQAEMLAFSGIEVAKVQLEQAFIPPKDKKQGDSWWNTWCTTLLPNLGVWQEFSLNEKYDNIEGTIGVCITCEAGKIPLSTTFDTKTQKISKSADGLLKKYTIKKKLPAGKLSNKLGDFIAKRKDGVIDVTQLASLADETNLALFYEPPRKPKKRNQELPPRHIALTDTFTIWSDNEKINPVCLTDSLRALCGVRRVSAVDTKKRTEQFNQIGGYLAQKKLKPENQWKFLEGMFDSKPRLSKEALEMFSSEIEPTFYSVICYGSVRGVTQRVLAILEVIDAEPEQAKKDGQKQKAPEKQQKKPGKTCRLRRLYWL